MSDEKGWTFNVELTGGGTLRMDGRDVAVLIPATPGHVIDTGRLIAALLNRYDREQREKTRPDPETMQRITDYMFGKQ